MARVFERSPGRWWIEFHHNGKKIRRSAGPSKREAERALRKVQTEIAEGRYLDKRRECKTTFKEFIPEYLTWARQNKRSAERDERSLKFLSRFFGSMRLDRISVAHVERYRRARLNGEIRNAAGVVPGPATVNREVACLRKFLNQAVAFGYLPENPLAGKISMLKEAEGRLKYLEPAQIRLLLAECSPRIKDVVHLLLLTGCRRNEILFLEWNEVDLSRGLIMLPGHRTKNGRPRTVPLSREALSILRRKARERLESCPFVFHENGRPLKSIREGFKRACKRAGLKDFRLHDLRHCAASAMAMRGVPLQVIAEVLGHRTLSMVQRYAHLSPAVLKAAVEQAAAYTKGEQIGAGLVVLEGKNGCESAAHGDETGYRLSDESRKVSHS